MVKYTMCFYDQHVSDSAYDAIKEKNVYLLFKAPRQGEKFETKWNVSAVLQRKSISCEFIMIKRNRLLGPPYLFSKHNLKVVTNTFSEVVCCEIPIFRNSPHFGVP